jgi:8-oxo-dGTP diphosphatase
VRRDVQGYVVGFAVDPSSDMALLVRKNRPDWQAGRLNGIGGHIEAGETPEQAMVREFQEETGLVHRIWQPMLRMAFPGAEVWFYRAHVTARFMQGAKTLTDEPIERHAITSLLRPYSDALPNLRWLLPLAAYTADRYEPFTLSAAVAEAVGATDGPAASGSGLPDTEEAADAPTLYERATTHPAAGKFTPRPAPPAPLALPDNEMRRTALRDAANELDEIADLLARDGYPATAERVSAIALLIDAPSAASPVPAALPPSPVGPAQGDGA